MRRFRRPKNYESRGQEIRAGHLQSRRPRFHARWRNSRREAREQESPRRRLGAVEDAAEAALIGREARCAVRGMSPERDSDLRTPQRGVPTRRVRKRLTHDVPLWVDPSKEDYFITVCCVKRGRNQLANSRSGFPMLETVKHRQRQDVWYAHLALLMPDHMHLILTFPMR